VALAITIVGCAAGDTTSSGTGTTGGTAGGGNGGGNGGLCVPGKQDFCACPGGKQGIQACLQDGSGYGPCDCGGGTGAGGSGTGGSGGGAVGCGDAFCAGGEDCHSCSADCGPCAPCTIAPSCDNATIPPVALNQVPEFDIPAMIEIPPAQMRANLEKYVAQGTRGARAIAAALAPPRLGESVFVTVLREAFLANPKASAAVKRQLARAGMKAPSEYSLTFPELEPPAMQPLNGEFPGGTPECGAPKLRIRVAKVKVIEEDDDFANDIVYCSVTSESADGGELPRHAADAEPRRRRRAGLRDRVRHHVGPAGAAHPRRQPAAHLRLLRGRHQRRLQEPARRRRERRGKGRAASRATTAGSSPASAPRPPSSRRPSPSTATITSSTRRRSSRSRSSSISPTAASGT
jgi:hypothetical protein